MYVGRFVVVSPTVAAYRVSSRSFPNRRIDEREPGVLTVGPTADAPPTDNPYVAYNCLRTVKLSGGGPGDGSERNSGADAAVLGNGSHVDPIAEKLELGYPARDALAESLLALDYEKDDYDTPRLAGVLDGETAHVGIVRRDALLVEAVEEPTLVATYERDAPGSVSFDATEADAAAGAAFRMDYEHAVCACGVAVGADGLETAIHNG